MTKRFTNTLIGASIGYLLLGLALIIWPDQSRLIICYALGAAAVLYGAYRIVSYFARSDGTAVVQFGLAIGIGSVLLGLFLLFKANLIIAIFAVIFGIILITDGVLRTQIALDIRRMGGTQSQWTPVLICALIVIALGVVLLFNPFAAVRTATIIAGVALLLDALLTIWSLFEARKTIQNIAPPRVK